MSISYQSKDDKVLSVALKVQELCVKLSDGIMAAGAGSTVVIEVGEPVAEVRAALHCDDSASDVVLVPQSGVAISTPPNGVVDSRVTLTLGAAITAADSVVLKYVVKE